MSLLGGACGGGGLHDPQPRLIPGGGVGDGAVKGVVHVHVIDARDGTPLEGARVRTDIDGGKAPVEGTTDASGLVSLRDESLRGPLSVTVTLGGYAATSFVGVNAANVTVPMSKAQTPPLGTAKAHGTIQGWDARPTPPANHILLAYIGYSFVEPLDAPENALPQETRQLGNLSLPANLCAKLQYQGTPYSSCNFTLTTRTGKQAHYAVIVDLDTKGTLADMSDDTYEIVDFAFLRDLEFQAGEDRDNEILVPVGTTNIATATVAFETQPQGLTSVLAYPAFRLGQEGTVVLTPTPFTPDATSRKIPNTTGPLAGAEYTVVAHAQAAANTAYPQSTIFLRNAQPAMSQIGPWLAPPTSFRASENTYSFQPAEEALLHTVTLLQEGTSGATLAWKVFVLDGSSSVSLPALSPSPLPLGAVTMRVEAVAGPTVNLQDFALPTLTSGVTRHSAGQIVFTRQAQP